MGGEVEVLLAIVSDKTGYPQETLDLDMDMEADLGIDSIKRVEILGGMQAQYPDLPKLTPETLAELRTLRQILSVYSSACQNAGDEEKPGNEVPARSSSKSVPTEEVVIPRTVPELKPLPAPDLLDFDLPAGEICLMTDDGTPAVLILAATLQQRGWKVVLLSLPCTPQRMDLPEGLSSAVLSDWSETQLQQRLDEIAARFGSTGVFIHLDPRPDTVDNGQALHKSILKHVFLIARYLKGPLTAAASQGRAAFISVAHLDGAFGLGENESGFDPLSGGLFGLVKTLNLEWPGVFCRAIDVHPGLAAEETARLILAELFDPNRLLVEVAVNSLGRFTLVAEPEAEMEMAA
jgi:acyl carrier protein